MGSLAMEKAVAQRDLFGCGIACVAYITGNSYRSAKRKYFKNGGKADKVGYWCKDLVWALSLAQKEYSYKYIKARMRFSEGTVVFIKRSKHHPAGHYLVRTRNGWMDPWINFDAKSPDAKRARAGFCSKLPGKPIYAIFPI